MPKVKNFVEGEPVEFGQRVEDYLEKAVKKGASDIHLKAFSPPIARINGLLINLDGNGLLTPKEIDDIFSDITDKRQKESYYDKQELDFAYTLDDVARFRVSVLQQRGTKSIAFRHIPCEIPYIDELGLPPQIKDLANLRSGLILITGPTGSGKSTTLAGMINHINETTCRHIITVEEPIEFVFSDKESLIQQLDVGCDTSSFSAALVQTLRHDPDVIVVGEMRDLETMRTAIQAAETGHLVMGTLHTLNAVQTIDRIIDMFPSEQQKQIKLSLAQVLRGIISQTIIPQVEGGQTVATGILIVSDYVRKLILDDQISEIPKLMEQGGYDGMHTINQSLAKLVIEGRIHKEDAMEKSHDPRSLLGMVEPNVDPALENGF
jgi:twitching motility protein PilT